MKLIRWEEVKDENIVVTDLQAYEITRRSRVFHPPTGGRNKNCLVYTLSGEVVYYWQDKTFRVSEGSLYYLPKLTPYMSKVVREPSRFVLVEFDMQDAGGEEVVFAEGPMVITDHGDQYYQSRFTDLADSARANRCGSNLRRMSLIYEILYNLALDTYKQSLQDGETSRIMEGILYLEKHYLSDITTETLAKKCSLSESQFRWYFKRHFGMSPVNYRNKLRMEKAYTLLKGKAYNVSEVAAIVGFDDVYYFSTLFKKLLGVTPISVLKGTRK